MKMEGVHVIFVIVQTCCKKTPPMLTMICQQHVVPSSDVVRYEITSFGSEKNQTFVRTRRSYPTSDKFAVPSGFITKFLELHEVHDPQTPARRNCCERIVREEQKRNKLAEQNNDSREEFIVPVVTVGGDIAELCHSLNEVLQQLHSGVRVYDLCGYDRMQNVEELVQTLRMSLHSDHISTEDPVALSYAIYRYVQGDYR